MVLKVYQISLKSVQEKIVGTCVLSASAFGAKNYKKNTKKQRIIRKI